MLEGASIWSQKGATLSDKSAEKEFGLSEHDIIKAIRAGKLQYRENNLYGNPYFRLLRHEVEALVAEKYGSKQLTRKKLKNELAQVNRELRKLKAQAGVLDKRRAELQRILGE